MIDKDFQLNNPQITSEILRAAGDVINNINPNNVRNINFSLELHKFDLKDGEYVIRTDKFLMSRPRFYCRTLSITEWNRNGEFVKRITYTYNKESKRFI